MREVFDIFIGGPMGKSDDDGAGLTLNDHLPNLRAAVERIAAELNREQSDTLVTVNLPPEDTAGMITDQVFGLIDKAELGILDISAESPSVMYELAMLHALGAPVIPISNRREDGSRPRPFYLKEVYQAVVSDFDDETLYRALRDTVRNIVLKKTLREDIILNPMSNYYGKLPMIEISATTGLATGYFHNFIRHVIKSAGGVFTQLDGEIDKLIILRPNSILEAEGLKKKIDKRLRDIGIEPTQVGNDDGKVYEDRDQARGQMLIFRAGRYLYDAPAPLAAQSSSPRYMRLQEMTPRDNPGTERESEAQSHIKKFENRVMDQFINRLHQMARFYPGCNPDYLRSMSPDKFLAAVQSAI